MGFDLVGFARADPFTRERELILEDLARGYMDGMAWITPERVTLSCDPEALLPGARSIIGLGTAYGHPPPEEAEGGALRGRVARYAWGRDYHHALRPKLQAFAEALVALAGPSTRCRSFVDTGPFVDRAGAERAGLGFVGKNSCLLTGQHGSYVFLSAVLTTAEIEPDPFIAKDCGSCRACIDACPTGALIAPGQLDARQCISYLTIEHRGPIASHLRPQVGNWLFGCDICQEVCPWNRARRPSSHAEYAPGEGAGPSLDLVQLLGMDEAAFSARFGGTALMRPKRRGLLRNAAVVLGNLRDPAAVPALLDALTDPEPLVRQHAAWALGRIQSVPEEARIVMEQILARESDPDARAELTAALVQSSKVKV